MNTTVTIDELLYSDPHGLMVFRATDGSGASRYVAQGGLFRAPVPGECWKLAWNPEEDPNYGRQRRVACGNLVPPTGEFIVQLLSQHPYLRGLGVGVVTATKLYRKYGPELAGILTRGELDKLPELPEDVSFELCGRWQALGLEPKVVTWLDERGLRPQIASKIVALYGAQAIDALETNPYCLLPFLPFGQIDAFARLRLGIAASDPRRLVAAVEASLYRDIDGGHTATRRLGLAASLSATCGAHVADAIALALDQQVAFARGDHLQAYAPALMERNLERWVKDICNPAGPQQQVLPLNSGSPLATVLAQSDGLVLTDEQRQAVEAAFSGRLHCIVGGAGVGKSTLLRLLAQLIVAVHGQACYMAISGRASRRIQEALGSGLTEQCSVSTVARYLLSIAPKLGADASPWLVVDEASMLDLRSAYRLVTESPPGARLVFVGDPHQLPPVGAGLFFHRLVAVDHVPRSELKRIFRQPDASAIPTVARQFRDGVCPELPPWDPSLTQGVQLQPAGTADAVAEAVRIRDALTATGSVQVLTVFRRAFGAAAINRLLHCRVPSATPQLDYPFQAAVGEPVIYTRNDPELNLQNGSMGVVLAVDPLHPSLLVRWDDQQERLLEGKALLYCELAYGITVHKAQGSQYERVIVVVPRAAAILDRALLYTAITRAQTQAVLVGDADAIRTAVHSKSNAHQRECLFLSP